MAVGKDDGTDVGRPVKLGPSLGIDVGKDVKDGFSEGAELGEPDGGEDCKNKPPSHCTV